MKLKTLIVAGIFYASGYVHYTDGAGCTLL